jgi:hypothetical protein
MKNIFAEYCKLEQENLLLKSKLDLAKSIIRLLFVICFSFIFLYATK